MHGKVCFFIFFICIPVFLNSATLDLKEDRLINKYLKNLKAFPKDVLKPNMKKTFLLRMGFIGAFIIGALIYIAIYFAFSF